jgi:hypothetical protein
MVKIQVVLFTWNGKTSHTRLYGLLTICMRPELHITKTTHGP